MKTDSDDDIINHKQQSLQQMFNDTNNWNIHKKTQCLRTKSLPTFIYSVNLTRELFARLFDHCCIAISSFIRFIII